MKTCKTCGKEKSLTEFYVKNKVGDKLRYAPTCKTCELEVRKERHHSLGPSYRTRKRCGMSEGDYNILLVESQGKCNICDAPFKGREPFLDHCHTTNKGRGLLCNDCNAAIGFSKDNIQTLESMIKYLQKHQ
jgi:hypothetical protein